MGDYKKALEYSKLDREARAFRADPLFILILTISAFCILLVFFLLVWRKHKKDQAEIQFYGHKYHELRQILYKHTDEYPKIEA